MVTLLARNTLHAGKRLLVVDAAPERRAAIGEALWARKDAFLAHGEAGGVHDARQPVLLSGEVAPANGATFLALADGIWRDDVWEGGEGFERVFLVFGEETVEGARQCWKMLAQRAGLTRHYWKQDGGRWTEAG